MISLSNGSWKIENIDTVLFDKDGTFIDLHFFWGKMTEMRVQDVILHYNLPQDVFENLCKYLGYNVNTKKMLSDGITAMYSRSKIIELFNDKLNTAGILSTVEDLEMIFDNVSEVFYKNMITYTKPIDEAIDFIKILKKHNIKVGIVTSDSIKSTELTIKQFGWHDLFDVIIGRESCKQPKESGEPVLLALLQLNSHSENSIMIGDTSVDFQSAQKAKLKNAILVATGQNCETELKETTDFVVKSLKDLNVNSNV